MPKQSTRKKSAPANAKKAKAPKRPAIPTFNPKQFFKQVGIPVAEQAAITDCLTRGIKNYYHHIYGEDKYGQDVAWLIHERMHEPYIFGFAAVEVARQAALERDTRLKVMDYTLQQIDATAEYGTPHGLPIMLSFIAEAGALDAATFRTVMIAADFGNSLFDDWQVAEIRQLLDWLVAQVEMTPAERLWWVWHLSINSEPGPLSQAVGEILLTHKVLLSSNKRALCEAWLSDSAAGQPPAQWEAIQALMQGDVAGYKQHVAEAGLPPIPDHELPPLEALTEDIDLALDSLVEDEAGAEADEVDAPATSLDFFRRSLLGPMGMLVLTPGPLKRLGVMALPALGVDPLEVCQKYLTPARGDALALHQGVVEVLRTHHTQMLPADVRALVERGVAMSALQTRKSFYELGAELYGLEFLERAAQDNANSLRQWAAKRILAAKKTLAAKIPGQPQRRGRNSRRG